MSKMQNLFSVSFWLWFSFWAVSFAFVLTTFPQLHKCIFCFIAQCERPSLPEAEILHFHSFTLSQCERPSLPEAKIVSKTFWTWFWSIWYVARWLWEVWTQYPSSLLLWCHKRSFFTFPRATLTVILKAEPHNFQEIGLTSAAPVNSNWSVLFQ